MQVRDDITLTHAGGWKKMPNRRQKAEVLKIKEWKVIVHSHKLTWKVGSQSYQEGYLDSYDKQQNELGR